MRRVATTVTAVVALGVVLPGVAQAEPPSNDDFDTSTVVQAVPFTVQLDTGAATRANDDPAWCQGTSSNRSVWFSYTPTEDVLLRATTAGSDYETVLSANTGTRGDLAQVRDGCGHGYGGTGATITFPARAGTTYHFMVGEYYSAGSTLSFGLQELSFAPHDAFADAEPITTLPASREVDLSIASTEYDEPASSPTCTNSVSRSVWYTFTPAETKSFVARLEQPYDAQVSVYTGSTLPELTEIGCANGGFSSKVLFRATEGTTYHLRVGGPSYRDLARMSLTEAPPLRPQIGVTASPTIYELTRFTGSTGEFGTPVASGQWDFGDGTVAPAGESGVSHHYTQDGTYQVRLSVTSPDGRTGTTTTTVTVNTHDVSISRFATPGGANVGETKEIVVRVANTRYRESATVTLYRSDGPSWEQVGTLTLDVPVSPDRTVRFPFAYTFTAEDAVVGKVAFRAVVTLPHPVRDARPFDNELISTATTVQQPAGSS